MGFWPCMGLALLGLGFNWELEIRVGVRVLGSVVKKVAISGGGEHVGGKVVEDERKMGILLMVYEWF